MVGLRDILGLAAKTERMEQSARRSGNKSYPDWSAEIPNQTDETVGISEVIIGQKFKLPDVCHLDPGEVLTIHYGGGHNSENEYYWNNAPEVRNDDQLYIVNDEDEQRYYAPVDLKQR